HRRVRAGRALGRCRPVQTSLGGKDRTGRQFPGSIVRRSANQFVRTEDVVLARGSRVVQNIVPGEGVHADQGGGADVDPAALTLAGFAVEFLRGAGAASPAQGGVQSDGDGVQRAAAAGHIQPAAEAVTAVATVSGTVVPAVAAAAGTALCRVPGNDGAG